MRFPARYCVGAAPCPRQQVQCLFDPGGLRDGHPVPVLVRDVDGEALPPYLNCAKRRLDVEFDFVVLGGTIRLAGSKVEADWWRALAEVLADALDTRQVDLVLSDMTPNMSRIGSGILAFGHNA
jgi:hypothetical protein